MNKVNRGKQFETQIRKAFVYCKDCAYLRLTDSTMGFAGVANPCDFVAYYYPNIYFIECKSCYGNTLPIANITEHQRGSLSAYAKIPGVVAGYMVWYIDHDVTVFLDALDVEQHFKAGNKSINIKDIESNTIKSINIPSKKKRVLCEYCIKPFFDTVKLRSKKL